MHKNHESFTHMSEDGVLLLVCHHLCLGSSCNQARRHPLLVRAWLDLQVGLPQQQLRISQTGLCSNGLVYTFHGGYAQQCVRDTLPR
jgi:hypothetical protein